MAQLQSNAAADTPASAAQTVHVCDVDIDPKPGNQPCNEPAVAAYRWEWGKEGVCCSKHQFLLRQRAAVLSRAIEFKTLPNAAPTALSRDERQRFHATILTLEDELRDAKARGLELYQSNTKLAEESRRLAARNHELEAQLKDMHSDLRDAHDARDEHAANLADVHDELQKLRAILPGPEAPPVNTARNQEIEAQAPAGRPWTPPQR